MRDLRIGLLKKKRGNVVLQEKFKRNGKAIDRTSEEVAHHRKALRDAGYNVVTINWGPDIINSLKKAKVDLVFNVATLVEAAILEELEIPYVGSGVFTIAQATDKSLAKKIWQKHGLPTSPFHVARDERDCEIFMENPPIEYPLFVKPVAGRGSCGITQESIVENYSQLINNVQKINNSINQPALIE